jgi:septum formation protein
MHVNITNSDSPLKKIILASGSPRRHALLTMIGLRHQVVPSTIDEILEPGKSATEVAISLSEQKALDVARNQSFDLIIAADTIVVLDGVMLGKPVDTDDAVSMLQTLSGKTHEVITAVTLLSGSGAMHSFAETTCVTFSELHVSEIKAYVSTGSPMDKAGAYGIQDDLGSLFVKRIVGDYYNVVGLPLQRLYAELKTSAPHIASLILKPTPIPVE